MARRSRKWIVLDMSRQRFRKPLSVGTAIGIRRDGCQRSQESMRLVIKVTYFHRAGTTMGSISIGAIFARVWGSRGDYVVVFKTGRNCVPTFPTVLSFRRREICNMIVTDEVRPTIRNYVSFEQGSRRIMWIGVELREIVTSAPSSTSIKTRTKKHKLYCWLDTIILELF